MTVLPSKIGNELKKLKGAAINCTILFDIFYGSILPEIDEENSIGTNFHQRKYPEFLRCLFIWKIKLAMLTLFLACKFFRCLIDWATDYKNQISLPY